MGTLYHGECLHMVTLEIGRRYVADEYIELIYLAPPFNSTQNYNVLALAGIGKMIAA